MANHQRANVGIGNSIREAYTNAIQQYAYREYLLIQIEDPIRTINRVPTDRDDWNLNVALDALNIGSIDSAFLDENIDPNRTVRSWIESDVRSYLHGHAYKRLTGEAGLWKIDQLTKVIEHLRSSRPQGSTSNKLVCHIFHPSEIPPNSPIENKDDCNCNTSIQFKPTNNGSQLNLHATFRSQYINTRAIGNLVGLSALLADVCSRVDHEPGRLVSITNNATIKNDAKDLNWIEQNL